MIYFKHFVPSLLNGRGCPLWVGVGLLLLASCQKVDFTEYTEPDTEQTATDEQGTPLPELFLTENDTARFFLSGKSYQGITLSDYPTPSTLITDSRYRMPTKSEASLLKALTIPTDYWNSKERILCQDPCYDAPETSPTYYTFTFGNTGSITKAGFKTKYTLLPIRTEHKASTTPSTQDTGFDITVNDEWE